MSRFNLNFPALIVGSIVPDLEVPIVFLISKGEIDRLVLHSILGSITLGFLISIFISFLLYPRFVGFMLPYCREELKSKCTISESLMISSLIGVLGHVLLDALHHEYNPLIYPFSTESIDDLVLFGDYLLASELVDSFLIIFGLLILFREIRLGRNGFWKRILVGYKDGKERDCMMADARFVKPMKLLATCPVSDLVHTSAEYTTQKMYKRHKRNLTGGFALAHSSKKPFG